MTQNANRPLPNLFIVGAPKAGTTFLYKYLAAHPDVFMCAVKEPHYFATDLKLPWAPSLTETEYLGLFEGAKTTIVGEASTWYLYSRTAARQIHSFNPAAKILVSLRNPVDLLYSLYWHRRFVGNETATSLEQALDDERRRREATEGAVSSFLGFGPVYQDLPRYAAQLERYLALFPRSNVYIQLFDEMISAPERCYRSISEFLGVRSDFIPDFGPANVSRLTRSSLLETFMKAKWVKAFSRLLPRMTRSSVGKALKQWNTAYGKKPEMDPLERQRIELLYESEIHSLERLLERDLGHWKYTSDSSIFYPASE